MKTKLAVVGLAMALGAWMATANSPTVRSLEQRVSELEQIVASQSHQLIAQQQQLDNLNWMIYMDDQGCVNVRGSLCVLGDYVIAKKIYYNTIYQY